MANNGLSKKSQADVFARHGSKRPFVDSYELPLSYNSTYLTLIPRDPNWIYAYWEVSPTSLESAVNHLGPEIDNAKRVLRMYDVTCVDFNGMNANHWFDVEVNQNSNNWYINLWKDNVSYCAELGLRLMNGNFFSFARSNCVATPRKTGSSRHDEIWMEVRNDGSSGDQSYTPAGKITGSSRQAEIQSASGKSHKRQTEQAGAKLDPQAEHRKRKRIFLTEEDVRRYYARLSPFLKEQIYGTLKKKLENEVKSIFKYSPADARAKGAMGDLAMRGLKSGEFYKKILQGSSAELTISGASESAVPVQGGASEQKQGVKNRKFFFELDAELIVYGRTEPDARVWHGDKPVKLRDDGTFTLRFAFPDGKIPLDFVAESNDGLEKREIRTAAERARTIRIPG